MAASAARAEEASKPKVVNNNDTDYNIDTTHNHNTHNTNDNNNDTNTKHVNDNIDNNQPTIDTHTYVLTII